VKIQAPTPGTIYGTITAVSFSTNTTVTVDWDSTELSNEAITYISVGIIQGAQSSQSYLGGFPVGAITEFASTAAEPTGWKFCNGQSLNRADYPDLFNVISTFFGASSTSTFTLPDLRGRTTVCLDNLGGTSANVLTSTAADTLGGTLGDESEDTAGSVSGSVSGHALTEAELPASVTISQTSVGDVSNVVTGNQKIAAAQSGSRSMDYTVSLGSGSAHTHSDNFSFSGSSMSIVQPSIALPKIIKAF
jgi:microcystin-dependent protein